LIRREWKAWSRMSELRQSLEMASSEEHGAAWIEEVAECQKK
jgi:hypothetical protein